MGIHQIMMARRLAVLTATPLVINPILQRVLDYATTNAITTPTGSKLTALNTYCNELETAGILAHTGSGGVPTSASDFTTSDVFVNFAYNNTALDEFSLIDWVRLIEMDVYGGMSYTVNGWESNGSTGYLDPLYNPSSAAINYNINNASMGCIVYKERTSGNPLIAQESGAVNLMQNVNSVVQRINRATSATSAIDLSGTGLLVLNRETINIVSGIQKANYQQKTGQADAFVIQNAKINFFRYVTTVFSDAGMANAFLGKHIPNTMAQDVRTATNTYLSAIGLSPIA